MLLRLEDMRLLGVDVRDLLRYVRYVRRRHMARVAACVWAAHYFLFQARSAKLYCHAFVRDAILSLSKYTLADLRERSKGDSELRSGLLLAYMISRNKTLHSKYWPFFLNHGILQTLISDLNLAKIPFLPASLRQLILNPPKMERHELKAADGGRLLLDISIDAELTEDSPVVLVLPGNLGDTHSPYFQSALRCFADKRWRPIVYVRRGCGDNFLQTSAPQNYADDHDLPLVVERIKARFPSVPLLAAGYSMGGNYLVRYLGDCGRTNRPALIDAAASLGNPFNLLGVSYFFLFAARLCDWSMRGHEQSLLLKNADVIHEHAQTSGIPIDISKLSKASSYREIVENYHAPMHLKPTKVVIADQEHAMDHSTARLDLYLLRSSSTYALPHVKIPLLCVTADDDPVVPPELVPYETFNHNPHIVMARTKHGGHHAYLSWNPFRKKWSDEAVTQWFESFLTARAALDSVSGDVPLSELSAQLLPQSQTSAPAKHIGLDAFGPQVDEEDDDVLLPPAGSSAATPAPSSHAALEQGEEQGDTEESPASLSLNTLVRVVSKLDIFG